MNPCLTAYLNCLLILLGGFLLINLMVYIYLRVKPDKSFEFAKNLFESFHSYQDIVDKSTDNYDIKVCDIDDRTKEIEFYDKSRSMFLYFCAIYELESDTLTVTRVAKTETTFAEHDMEKKQIVSRRKRKIILLICAGLTVLSYTGGLGYLYASGNTITYYDFSVFFLHKLIQTLCMIAIISFGCAIAYKISYKRKLSWDALWDDDRIDLGWIILFCFLYMLVDSIRSFLM